MQSLQYPLISIEEQIAADMAQLNLGITESQVGAALTRKPELAWRDAVSDAVNAQISVHPSVVSVLMDLHLLSKKPR